MTLKPIVASVFLLGLASSSAFAAASSNAGTRAELDAMKAKIAKMEAVLQQNQSGGFQQANDWFNRVTLSGEANVDGLLANSSLTSGSSHHSSDINLNNANLFVDFIASDWTKGHLSLAYQQKSPAFARSTFTGDSSFTVDEAYVTIENFTKSPFFFMAGKQYVNFGDYHRYPMVATLPQLLEETRATAARVGFVDASGFNASASLFRGAADERQTYSVTGATRVQNFAVNAGFANQTDNLGYRLGVSYLNNMADVNYLGSTDFLSLFGQSGSIANGYLNRVGAISAYAGVNSGPFDAGVNYVTALQNFNVLDLPTSTSDNNVIRGAKPAAWSIDAGYSFMTIGHQSRVGLGYEGSKEAALVGRALTSGSIVGGMPKSRYQVNYTVNVSKYTDVGFQVYYDRDYDGRDFGTGKNSLAGVARLAVKFA